MKLPALPGNPKPTRKDRAVAKRQEFADTVAALRRQTGKVESKVIRFRCAVTGNRFTGAFERSHPSARFKVARIDKAVEHKGLVGGHLTTLFAPVTRPAGIPVDQFSWDNIKCPWCGDETSLTLCGGCDELVCGGRSKPRIEDERYFRCCEACGQEGPVSGSIDTVSASDSSTGNRPGRGPKGDGKPPASNPALQAPRSKLPTLPWRKR